jgi:spore germination protein GerM
VTELPAYRRFGWPLWIVIAAVGTMALVGCGSDDDTITDREPVPAVTGVSTPPVTAATDASPPDTTSTPVASTRTVRVWFLDTDGTQLVSEQRDVPADGSELRGALVALAEGPQTPAAVAALPAGTEIVGTNVAAGEALVNLSGQFVTGYPPGGAAAELAVVAPIVYTATEIEGVERVRITVDGQTPAPTGTQFDFGNAFTRADFPDILVAP